MKKLLFPLLVFAALIAGAVPFTPMYQGTRNLTCGVASSRVALASTPTNQQQLVVRNAGTVVVFIEFGDSTVASALATGYPVFPNQPEIFSPSPLATHAACISGTAGQTVYFSMGQGE